MIVNLNILAMNAQRQFTINNKSKQKSTEKLSSGYRINRSADDAAELAISEKMRRQIRGLTQGVENTQDGISLCQVADGALNEVDDMLHRITELSVQAANGTNSDEDREYLQKEVRQLISEIDRISETTTFNEQYILKETVYTTGRSITRQEAQDLLKDGVTIDEDLKDGDGNIILSKVAANVLFKEAKIYNDVQELISVSSNGETLFDGVGGSKFISIANIYKEYYNLLDDIVPTTIDVTNELYWGRYYLEQFATATDDHSANMAYGVMSVGRGDIARKFDGEYQYIRNIANAMCRFDNVVNNSWGLYHLVPGEAPNGVEEGYKYGIRQNISNILPGITEGVKGLFEHENVSPSQVINRCIDNLSDKESYIDLYVALFDNGRTHYIQQHNWWIQSGTEAGDGMNLEIDAINSSLLRIKNLNVSNRDGANNAIEAVKGALEKVSSIRSKIGAQQNRLEHTVANENNIIENTTAAESLIRDTDMADEMTKLSVQNILEQAGISMIAQANQSNQGVLQLLR